MHSIPVHTDEYYQGRIEPPKAARGHATSYSARIDSIMLNVTIKIALPGNHVVVSIRYVCSDVRYVCRVQLEKQYLFCLLLSCFSHWLIGPDSVKEHC